MLHFIALRGVRAHKNVVHLQHRYNRIYSDRNHVIELLVQFKNKQQIMQNNVETQIKHTHSLYIQFGSLCNITLSMAHFTCIVTTHLFSEA